MKNKYLITLTGSQSWDGDENTTEMLTDGSLSKVEGGYVIKYDEIPPFGGDAVTTEFSVIGNTVTMQRGDDAEGKMVFEKGQRHTCWYNTPMGSFAVGICTQSIESHINTNGGSVSLGYTIDINSALRGQNKINISVKKAENKSERKIKS